MLAPDPIPLADFLTGMQAELAADPVAALTAACDVGLGIWTRPDAPCTMADRLIRRPATHLHEITLLDVSAVGDTERAAAANWLYVARWTVAAQAPGVAA